MKIAVMEHFILLPITFFVMLISYKPLGVILTVNASETCDYEIYTVTV
jgi:hypothetical protein